MANIQTVNVEVTALTDKGPVESAAIKEVVARRMAELGYIIVEASKPADVVFKVKVRVKKDMGRNHGCRRGRRFAGYPVSVVEGARLSVDLSIYWVE